MHWRRKWQPTPVFLPGESQAWRSLVGCRLWGCTEQIAIFIITTRSGPRVTHLPTPRDLLVKNPKLIADPIAIGSQAQCCH